MNDKMKLEQLEHLHFEDTPAASWLPILLSHIESRDKRRQSQSYKFKEFAKISNFYFLLDKMCKYKMDLTSTIQVTERTRFCPQTDGQTGRWRESIIPPFQLRWRGGYNKLISCWFYGSLEDTNYIPWHRNSKVVKVTPWWPFAVAMPTFLLVKNNVCTSVTMTWIWMIMMIHKMLFQNVWMHIYTIVISDIIAILYITRVMHTIYTLLYFDVFWYRLILPLSFRVAAPVPVKQSWSVWVNHMGNTGIHKNWSHNHNKIKHNKTMIIFCGIYCISNRGETIDFLTATSAK